MSWPAPAEVLRHQAPALLVGTIDAFDGGALRCASSRAGRWRWPEILEGAVQSAGLLAGLQPGGLSNNAVIAEYRGVIVHAAAHQGTIRFLARVERRLLGAFRCAFEARAADGAVLLEGTAIVAPGR